ncbi:primosomal protein N' [Fuchsiella alkaliacetigena]|uniref:primosomal protein N' n=1 Tax=Fuchsiella alkaliacetigena TaxID=957042 RepID=UPI002009DF3D|nr:primosomal protein N' [Fuchsiella alkaliacetigena]MCK8823621.1 primosomal protein N' [Fuchsiella alkaliacetigena]
MEVKYAEVVVDLAVEKVDQAYTYRVPTQLKEQLQIGHLVKVPFGNRNLKGYVISLSEELDSEFEIKDILAIEGSLPLFDRELLSLAKWMAKYYQSYLTTALKCIIPSGQRRPKQKRVVKLSYELPKIRKKLTELSSRAYKQREVLNYLIENHQQQLTVSELAEAVDTYPGTVYKLHEKGLIEYEQLVVRRNPYAEDIKTTEPLQLTAEQEEALAKLRQLRARDETGTLLLKGVTGSGKTEVYLQAIRETLARGEEAIVLVPEISLTPQTVNRFKSRFGRQVAIYHSRLSAGERFDEWLRMKQGQAQVVVGARSAIFAPFSNLGLIVIDEEHESSYKQSDHPKYHARRVAIERARLAGALTLLGTATPALESYYRAQQGEYELVELSSRIADRPLPPVEIVDLRQELKQGNKSIFSSSLATAIEDRLAKEEQIILFLNRRGFANFVLCRECGYVLKCEHCDVSLTYHAQEELLRCHYCDYQLAVPKLCPYCQSRYIKHFGVGTQQVEEAVHSKFPTARTLRMDLDTTTYKGAHRQLLNRFKRGEADILIGTQMIAKGHDFPQITLVGVITADTALNFPDFRAAETTFQLLTQVAGRTGRGDITGQVIIQSYTPEHYSIQLAKEHDYRHFYEQEIKYRRDLAYPPFTRLINFIIRGEQESSVAQVANQLGSIMAGELSIAEQEEVDILGPSPAALAKLRGEYRWQLILKGKNLALMRELGQRSLEILNNSINLGKIVISVDIEPIGML